MNGSKTFDIVLFGASGFTGKLVAQYLLNYSNREQSISWAIAGRSASKLEQTLAELECAAGETKDIPIIIADSFNEDSLNQMTKSTKVIISTVGPYLKYGESLVKSCIENNAHYCDLTGEAPFIYNMIKKYHDQAVEKKVKIVHACGFDSIPSDIGVLLLQNEAISKLGKPFEQIEFVLNKSKGGPSGGTVASIMTIIEQSKIPEVRKALFAPYSLYPKGVAPGKDSADTIKPRYHKYLQRWLGPFVMGPINVRVVRRSNALLNFQYGEDFRYSEEVATGTGAKGYLRASGMGFGVGAFFVLASISPIRKHLLSRLLPKEGEGPSKEMQESGFFNISLYGRSSRQATPELKMKVIGPKDPGYGSTSMMLAESALALAIDSEKLPPSGGILTPASAIGPHLATRLEKTGILFELKQL